MLENKFKKIIRKEIENRLLNSIIIFNDPQMSFQGIPDILVLWKNKWAMLEVKKSKSEPFRPNQEYYLEMFNDMSYASMICPENMEEIIDELESTFRS